MPSFISNLSVAKRLGLGFALVLVFSFITIIVGITRLAAVAVFKLADSTDGNYLALR
jgi:methyl-accepting chemotaxis protein